MSADFLTIFYELYPSCSLKGQLGTGSFLKRALQYQCVILNEVKDLPVTGNNRYLEILLPTNVGIRMTISKVLQRFLELDLFYSEMEVSLMKRRAAHWLPQKPIITDSSIMAPVK